MGKIYQFVYFKYKTRKMYVHDLKKNKNKHIKNASEY